MTFKGEKPPTQGLGILLFWVIAVAIAAVFAFNRIGTP